MWDSSPHLVYIFSKYFKSKWSMIHGVVYIKNGSGSFNWISLNDYRGELRRGKIDK